MKEEFVSVSEAASRLKLSRSQVYRIARAQRIPCKRGSIHARIFSYKPRYCGDYEGTHVSLYTFFMEHEEDFLQSGIDRQLWRRLIARSPIGSFHLPGISPANGKPVKLYLRDDLLKYKILFTGMEKEELYRYGKSHIEIGWGGKYARAYQLFAEGSFL